MNGLSPEWPTWLRDVDSLLATHSHFVLAGNVRDWYQLPVPEWPVAKCVAEALSAVLDRSGFDVILVHDIVDGFTVLSNLDEDEAWAAVQAVTLSDLRDVEGSDFSTLGSVIRSVGGDCPRRLAVVLSDASRLINRIGDLQPAELDLFRIATKAAQESQRFRFGADGRVIYNPIFWLVEREHDLPSWFTANNSPVRTIAVPLPDLSERTKLSNLLMSSVEDDSEREQLGEDLAAGTDGLGSASIAALAALFNDQNIPYSEPAEAIRTYKIGAAESPWVQGGVAERLRGGADLETDPDAVSILSSKVLGQPRAVTKVVDILTRAVMGLSGAQAARSSSRPRGVLFFVGPTGTGKTELSKSITELVFGTSDAYTRFDMSEFSAEHAGDRLIGAPPGYVGFDAGGELTNAVRERPHSLLLFDEIEKAHPLILDKFLQILEDGRLTDGRGSTVHFSETLIVFTSNIGTYRVSADGNSREPSFSMDDSFLTIEERVRSAVGDFFSVQLNRPELLNRIGDNIVVFDVIRPEVAQQIVELQVSNVLGRVNEAIGISITMSDEASASIQSMATADRSFGGRGIGNVIESQFVNPLARALFKLEAKSGDSLFVESILEGQDGPEVILR